MTLLASQCDALLDRNTGEVAANLTVALYAMVPFPGGVIPRPGWAAQFTSRQMCRRPPTCSSIRLLRSPPAIAPQDAQRGGRNSPNERRQTHGHSPLTDSTI